MVDKLVILLLWAVAIGAVVFSFVNQREPGRSSVARPATIGGWRGVVGIIGAALFMLLLTGCGPTKRVVESLPTPAERLICESAGTRPAVPPEYVIDWTKVRTVAQAKSEHEKFVAVLRTREGIVAGYIVQLEGKHFLCFTNAQWRRDYEAGLAK